MAKTIHMRGYVRPMPRITEAGQLSALAEHGLSRDRVYVEGAGAEGLDGMIRSLRHGEVVAVTRVHILAAPKIKTSDRPRRALWDAVHAIEAKGASILEIETGRRSTDPSDRDAMIADAIEQITHSGRAPRKRDTPGRPPAAFTPEQIEAARAVWESRSIKTWDEVRAKLPKGFSAHRAYKMFGRRTERPTRDRTKQMWVYFAQAGRGPRIKIGTTSNLSGRLKGLKHPLIGKLRVLGVVPGGYEVESRMHQRFAAYRIKGEWFNMAGELEEFVDRLRKSKR